VSRPPLADVARPLARVGPLLRDGVRVGRADDFDHAAAAEHHPAGVVNPRLRIYGLVVGGIYWVALAVALALNHGVHSFSKMAPLVALAVAGEELVVRQRDSGAAAISFSAVAHVAAAVLLSPTDAAATAALGIVIADGLRSDSRRFLLINSAMFGISTWAAALSYQALGGGTALFTPRSFVALMAVLAVRYAITTSIFCGGMAVSGRGSFFGMLGLAAVEELGSAAGEGSLGVLVAAGAAHTTATLPFLLPLFGALYSSKANLERLRTETQRALNAMADVIDARDPSTAAHSERVAEYVERFVEALALAPETAEQLVATARYHDLGKIAVDVRTLTTADRLTDEELRQIREHPRLSSQLLRPFSFAREMAEFAELHHERFDGGGYYGVKGENVPIESHVLIVIDSYDAMTSSRPYRPALTQDEAIEELLDKSGTQFHPLVARTFVAVLNDEPLESTLTTDEIAALRSAFRGRAVVPWRPTRWQPRTAFVASIVLGLSIAGLGLVPVWAFAVPGAAAIGSAAAWLYRATHLRRRRQRAESALEQGLSADAVVAEAGFAGSAGWLPLDAGTLPATFLPGIGAASIGEVQSWARRRLDAGVVQLGDGATVVFSGITRERSHYVLGLIRPPRRHELELVEWVAAMLAGATAQPGMQREAVIDQRSPEETRVTVLVALECFDRVRRGAGQLVAERVVSEVERALRRGLRNNDAIVRLGEDTFGISALATEREGGEQLEAKILEAIDTVRLPARLTALTPRVVAGTAASDPELAAIEARLLPGAQSQERVR
jgi:GGDEF domain-containing protein